VKNIAKVKMNGGIIQIDIVIGIVIIGIGPKPYVNIINKKKIALSFVEK
jgi:hypothetical protein